MKRILTALSAAFVLSTAAQADPFASAYGNTVTQTWPDGTKIVIFINQNGTWEQHIGGKVAKGIFTLKNSTDACFTTTDPVPADPLKATGCIKIKRDHQLGEIWTEVTPDGKTIHMTITAGRS